VTAPHLVSLQDIRAAAGRIDGAVWRTPLIPASLPPGSPSGGTGARIWLKCENLQRICAFKARGAYNFVSRVSAGTRAKGLITYSSGNHAQAVAFAARSFGVSALITMPDDAPGIKRRATEALGATVEFAGTTSESRRLRAEEILDEEGGVMVPPFDHPDIIAGQGTVGLEICEQAEALANRLDEQSPAGPDVVLVPIGGGGLAAGVSTAVKALRPEARVIGVEPEAADAMRRSIRQGSVVTLDSANTVADGLKPLRPGDLTFAHCRALLDEVATVTDEQILSAVGWLHRRRLVVEPSGAATVAAVLGGAAPSATAAAAAGGQVVAVLSGGNIEPTLLADVIAR